MKRSCPAVSQKSIGTSLPARRDRRTEREVGSRGRAVRLRARGGETAPGLRRERRCVPSTVALCLKSVSAYVESCLCW